MLFLDHRTGPLAECASEIRGLKQFHDSLGKSYIFVRNEALLAVNGLDSLNTVRGRDHGRAPSHPLKDLNFHPATLRDRVRQDLQPIKIRAWVRDVFLDHYIRF